MDIRKVVIFVASDIKKIQHWPRYVPDQGNDNDTNTKDVLYVASLHGKLDEYEYAVFPGTSQNILGS